MGLADPADPLDIGVVESAAEQTRPMETVRAILAAVFLDMDLALDVYLKAIERERAARMEKLGALIADFDRTANEVFGTVGEAAQRIGEVVDLIDAIAGIGKTIAEVNDIATAIAAAVEQQGAATDEIARNVQEAAKGTQEVSGNIAGVNKAASETGGSAEKALGTARTVTAQTDALKDTIEGFLSEVKAA